MRISSSISAAFLAYCASCGCDGGGDTSSRFVDAFLPPHSPSSHSNGVVGVGVGDGRRRRAGTSRLSASSSSSSLMDQLSSLSYDGLSLKSKLANDAARHGMGRVPAIAPPPSSSSSSSSAIVPPPTTDMAFPDPTGGSFADIVDKLSSATSRASTSFASTYDAIVSTITSYERMIDVALSDPSFVGADAWTSIRDNFGPRFDAFAHEALRLPNDIPPSVAILLSSIFTYYVVNAITNVGRYNDGAPPSSPYPMNRYDPSSARRYFDARPSLVAYRATEIALLSATFLSGLAMDYLTGNLKSNSQKRADQLTILLARLGPSFIKVGQSLSIRTDLLSPEYVRGLKALQDQCPPFDTADARRIIEAELGGRIEDMFVDFPSEPIAAASLGQVYRATTRPGRGVAKMMNGEDDDVKMGSGSGRVVAVKVQRPGIDEQIALDMHLIREVAGPIKNIFNLNTDFVGVVDAWGTGFVDELDYVMEAINAKSFSDGISRTPLGGVVFAPPVVDDLTTRRVLTSEWIVGERLDRSARDDVSVLCSIAMNSYLTMMLETGLLHCDPHPGNLLRTTDGKLCILDWGMVTRLDPDLQITLIEHMAHLTSADYEEVPKDLLLLGFIPENKADLIKDSGVVETLAEIYGAWTGGGGAAAINVNKVIADLQDLTAEKGNLFQIPPYFAYIAKSFSVLEGIGLSNDPKYSIINECLPYISKRLLTDKSERTGGALSTFIFGPDKSNEDRIIDYDRVEQLVTGFGDYTTSASGELLGKNSTRAEIIEGVATQVLDLLVTEEDTPLQRIFIEQLAKIITSTTRSAWSRIRERSGTLPSGRTVLGTLVDPLGVFKNSPIVRVDELDERTVETTRNLIQLLANTNSQSESTVDFSTLSRGEITEITSIVAQKLFERRSGVVKTSNRLVTQLLQLTADRLEKGGGRDIVVVPSSDPIDSINDGRIRDDMSARGDKTSDRLASARRILATIEQ